MREEYILILLYSIKNMDSEDNFKQKFLNINFDAFLFENNNDLVNSNEFYLQYKTEYMLKTQQNLDKYSQLMKNYNRMENNYNIQSNKYTYTFFNKDEYNRLHKELNNILVEQRNLYTSFMNYIEFLNSK